MLLQMRFSVAGLLVAAGFAAMPSANAANNSQPNFSVTPIPCPPSLTYCNGGGISGSGKVIGFGYPASVPSEDDPPPQGFIDVAGVSSVLPVPSGAVGFWPSAINAKGLIAGTAAGTYVTMTPYPYRGTFDAGTVKWKKLLNPAGLFQVGAGEDLNEAGTTVGSDLINGRPSPVEWKASTRRAVALPLTKGYDTGDADAVDRRGDVLGYEYCVTKSGRQCGNGVLAFWPSGREPILLKAPIRLAGDSSIVNSRNGKVLITGSVAYDSRDQEACLWTWTPATGRHSATLRFQTLGFLSGDDQSYAAGVNTNGWIVGSSGSDTNPVTATLWRDGHAYPLSGQSAVAINSRNQIVVDNSVLTPVPSPAPSASHAALDEVTEDGVRLTHGQTKRASLERFGFKRICEPTQGLWATKCAVICSQSVPRGVRGFIGPSNNGGRDKESATQEPSATRRHWPERWSIRSRMSINSCMD